MKKYIDIESWPRKAQYKLFKQMDYPHFNICANVDITEMYSYVKANDISFPIRGIQLLQCKLYR